MGTFSTTALAELPDAARRMLQTAIAGGDAAAIQVVAGTIMETYPDDVQEVRAILSDSQSGAASEALGKIDAATQVDEEVVPMVKIVEPPAPAPPLPTGFFGFDGWGGDVQLAGSLNTGNTDEKAAGMAFTLKREGDRWRHYFDGSFDFTRTNGITSKQRFRLGYETNYNIDDRSYIFGSTEYVDDRFSGYSYRIVAAGGYGNRIIKNDDMLWELEAGPGYRYAALSDGSGKESEIIGLANSKFEWQISDSTLFRNEIDILYGKSTATFDTLTSITMAINAHLSGRLSFETNTDTSPPAGTKNTDTQTKASLVYGF